MVDLLLLATVAITQTGPGPRLPMRDQQDILRAHIDPKVDPGVDFYRYANGGWFSKNPIPSSESRWGIVSLVRNEIDEKLRTISENAANANDSRPGFETD
jgi:predicted metalloendopeptidase